MKEMDPDSVREFIRREVPDWDDEVVATARFKAFSGQRCDWEPKFHFWRDLILKVSRQFGVFIIDPIQVKKVWFDRGGLTPLCIDHVLSVMYNDGDLMRFRDLEDPGSGRISRLLRKLKNLTVQSAMTPEKIREDRLVIIPLLQEKVAEIVKLLSEGHWTSTCVVTLKQFQNLFNGPDEASAVLSYLSGCGKAHFLSINRGERIEGVKISLTQAVVSNVSSVEWDVLHLLRTTEKLQDQVDVTDQRYETSRKSALVLLKSGNKKAAMRHARELKLATESREKYTSLLNRVEEMLNVVADSESTKMVSEAIKTGARAMKEFKISAEEVHVCLEEIEETIESQKQLEKTLESAPYPDIEVEDIEEEFMKLEMELESGSSQGRPVTSDPAEILSDMLSGLKFADSSVTDQTMQQTAEAVQLKDTEKRILEAA
ncbi:PREDICTED: charged multivesicular body protein 7 [Tarenaya hassleriana]|uniref:charged multivesicular body protein 7 n=1 Tax=Tarenaya hassleriana TaxID=28532 RepID=UPI00053C6914|nr:PREDICTED: charged multivesicular body protein 7 [Tarenaya hassleriana]